ncbi:CinA family protein [Legionella waltersii]|uniref:CinA-like competence damage protein n=1 Tax=Legionella waltersii TaxID=66969 RepID=A0A0W1AAJ8_9GAMM|nr:CinA family protein [Legionella waltersii]KTD78367.1 CinA-like competence damage protein [Legionella waltersii]SNV06425.1 putative 17.2kDa protein, CinA-related competence damage protein [Legionella waltersii]
MNQYIELIKDISTALSEHHWKLVTAESCTGGLISTCLTDMPGSSNWFERGFVTYSNASKEEMLSVPHDLMKRYGAVSEEVALAMALGAIEHSHGDVAVSVTGIAGPDGGTLDKPVGTVCFSWALRDLSSQTARQQFSGNRQEIRAQACHYALNGALFLLKNS